MSSRFSHRPGAAPLSAREAPPLTMSAVVAEVTQTLETAHPDLLRYLVWTPDRVERLTEAVDTLLASRELDPPELKTLVRRSVVNQITGLGPLDELLLDDTVTEILVNRSDEVLVERNGQLGSVPSVFLDDAEVKSLAQRLAARVGRSLTTESPMVDARLGDGSRIAAIIPPVSQHPAMAIRRAREHPPGIDDLLAEGAVTPAAWAFLQEAVRDRLNVVIAGGAGVGKTHLMRLLAEEIPVAEHVVTIEDVRELQLHRSGVVSLETAGRFTVHDLFLQALRLRPDRILVGEVRGGEALDLIEAMSSGHPGSLTTVHSPGPGADTIHRLARAALRNTVAMPYESVLDEVWRAVQVIVFVRRGSDGQRRIGEIDRVQRGRTTVVFREDPGRPDCPDMDD